MTSRNLERMLRYINSENGHAHIIIWVDGHEHEVIDVEKDSKTGVVKVIASYKTLEDDKGRTF